jgi:hypothetical protein
MKRLFVIIKILLFSSVGLFGHPFDGFLIYFHTKPTFEFFEETFANKHDADGRNVYTLTLQRFKAVTDNSYTAKKYIKFMKYFNPHTYPFINNGEFYMLSCGEDSGNIWNETLLRLHDKDDNLRVGRGIYLFRLDDTDWF